MFYESYDAHSFSLFILVGFQRNSWGFHRCMPKENEPKEKAPIDPDSHREWFASDCGLLALRAMSASGRNSMANKHYHCTNGIDFDIVLCGWFEVMLALLFSELTYSSLRGCFVFLLIVLCIQSPWILVPRILPPPPRGSGLCGCFRAYFFCLWIPFFIVMLALPEVTRRHADVMLVLLFAGSRFCFCLWGWETY